jgi:hypothetical protein
MSESSESEISSKPFESNNIKENEIININNKNILLKLGDIILIKDPTNEILNNNIFLIEYIDNNKLKLINSDNFNKIVLPISFDGIIGNGNIQNITIISSNPEKGFARQNNLLPDTWINIYFGGEFPTVITGEITNLEEDMIEIKTTDNDILYINFNYSGIPEELPIETFEIRPAPEFNEEKEENKKEVEEEKEQEEQCIKESREKEILPKLPTKEIKERINNILLDINDIEFGDIIKVEEYVNIDKEKYRFNIETQTNDLLEELVSNIPNNNRTNSVLNNIHIMITRFLQLRKLSSKFDNYKNVSGIIYKSADDRPLAEYLSQLKNNLYWVLLVANNTKKIYANTPNESTSTVSDVDIILQNENLIEIESLFKNYKSNQTIEGQNKYSQLYQTLDPYLTPFYSNNINNSDNVFSNSNGIIIEGEVQSNINAIVDNLGQLYSTVVKKSQLINRRFVIQTYNLGLDKLHANNFKGPSMNAFRVKLTHNDVLSLNSILTLPEPTVKFSQINLPGTDLLVKANLNLHFLNYWELLKQKTVVTPIVIDGLDNQLEYDETNFIDNIKQYILDLSEYEKPTNLTNLDIYKIFLKTIIPKIRTLFTLVKKYIKGKLSLIDVVRYLEPFLIYPIDLTYNQYNDINSFIYEKIKDYNRTFKLYSTAFGNLKYIKTLNRRSVTNSQNELYYSNVLFYLLDNDLSEIKDNSFKNKILDVYGFENINKNLSNSEILKEIIIKDYGNLYNTSVALTNIPLMYPTKLNSLFELDKDKINGEKIKDKEMDKCETKIISKKYLSKEALIDDNNKTIYFDKEYDTTNYNIIEEKYKRQYDSLSEDEFLLFLVDSLKVNQKLTEDMSEYMAETLINQMKKVKEGDYAVLINIGNTQYPETMEYYTRQNNIWVLDKDIDPTSFIKDDDILCNIEKDCIYNEKVKDGDKCISMDVTKDVVIENVLKGIIDQFDKRYDITKSELNSHIQKQLQFYSKSFEKLQELKRTNYLKYTTYQYELGLTTEIDGKQITISPYSKLRNLILGQNDYVKKQTDILLFVKAYCREANPDIPNIQDGDLENEWWLYCKQTNTRLLPKFIYILADTFITKNEKYNEVLNDLKRKIGKVGDDGDAWVDKNSGEIICYIDLDVTEGYIDGYKDKSRDIIEKDTEEILVDIQIAKKEVEKKNAAKKRLSPEGEMVSNIISIIANNMGIDIESSRDWIIKYVTEMMNNIKIIEKEVAYKKREEEAAKKGKKLPTYALVYSSTLLYLTLGLYLIAVQTTIPSIRSRKTAPGCIRSFIGFPFNGEGDESALNYVACVALKSRDPSTIPWNILPKQQDKIAATIKSFIIRFLLPMPEIEEKFAVKTEYLLTNPEEIIPEEHDLLKWSNFLPPLVRFKINNLVNVGDGFLEELHNDLMSGNKKQTGKLLVVQSKIIAYSFALQECIQNIVDKKDLLLKASGKLFIDNACCNETSRPEQTTLNYFINEDENISNYNKVVSRLTNLLVDVKLLTESAVMLSEINTKLIYPDILNTFDEETIYLAFICFCKFQSNLPLSEELASVCIDKPEYFKKMDSIQEKITKLKRDGRNYTNEQFLRLFQIVCKNNIIPLSLIRKNYLCIDSLKQISENSDSLNIIFKQKFDNLIEDSDLRMLEDSKEMRSMKDYLDVTNKNMKKELFNYIKQKGKITNIELKNIGKFLEELTNWKYDQSVHNKETKIADDGYANYIQYLKNSIKYLSVIFPTMILNETQQTINPPRYWGFSKDHILDLKKMMEENYSNLSTFYGNNTIKNVLLEVKQKTKVYYLLSLYTPLMNNVLEDEKEWYNVFDKRIVTLLYEYYFLNILVEYIKLATNPKMVTKLLEIPKDLENDLVSTDYLIEQQLRFTEPEQDYIEGDVSELKTNIAKLITTYFQIMIKNKKTLNVSYEDIEDRVFKLKEAEKYSFTDRLKDLSEEKRAVDTILKHHKLGPLYSLGLSKSIKEYDPDNFDRDKRIAEDVASIQKKLRKRGVEEQDMDLAMEEVMYDRGLSEEINRDEYNINETEDFYNGDPWGDETENRSDYD